MSCERVSRPLAGSSVVVHAVACNAFFRGGPCARRLAWPLPWASALCRVAHPTAYVDSSAGQGPQ